MLPPTRRGRHRLATAQWVLRAEFDRRVGAGFFNRRSTVGVRLCLDCLTPGVCLCLLGCRQLSVADGRKRAL